MENDKEYREVLIASVGGSKSDGWSITDEDGWSLGVDGDSPVEPKPGMVARMYGRGIGYAVRGLTLDGQIVRYTSPEEQAAQDAQRSRDYEERRKKIALEPTVPERQVDGFHWTEDMRQISGFGGGYERTCRAMVSAGCKWWSEHSEADPQFHGYKGVYGVIAEDNDDAKTLSKVVEEASNGDCSGAMHQASISHVMAWRHLGSWIAYQGKMREMKREDGED